jgi:hypothetical protein
MRWAKMGSTAMRSCAYAAISAADGCGLDARTTDEMV